MVAVISVACENGTRPHHKYLLADDYF